MNLVALQTFLAIVKTGSLVRASAQMNVTQSTVTARLQALETELGQTLVLRQKNGATLTSAGIKLRRYADAMTQLWDQARQETSLPPGIEAICNLGVHSDLWLGLGQRFFDNMREMRPSIALSVWHGSDNRLAQWLTNGLVDVAISCSPPPHMPGLSFRPLRAERLVLVGSSPDRPVRRDPGYVFVEAGPVFEREHTAAYADADTARLSFNNAEWARIYLLENAGSAYLPYRMVAEDLIEERLYLLSDAPEFLRASYLVTRDSTAAYADVIEYFSRHSS